VNAWLAAGGRAQGVKAGSSYVDVGTLHGYRAAIRLLAETAAAGQRTVPVSGGERHSRRAGTGGVGTRFQTMEQ
jgi:hypothetical protein